MEVVRAQAGLPSPEKLAAELAPLDEVTRKRRIREVITLLGGAAAGEQQDYRDALLAGEWIRASDWKSSLAEAKKAFTDERRPARTPRVPGTDGEGLAGLVLDPGNQATELVNLAREHYDLFPSEDGRTWAVERRGPNIAIPLGRKGRFTRRLARRFIEETGRAPGDQAIGDAMRIITAYLDDEDPRPVHLRVARHGKDIVLDLGRADGKCVVVSAGKWEVTGRSPVPFRRGRTGPLPLPVHGDSGLKTLRKLLNVGDDLFRLAVACEVCYLIPGIPYPITGIRGEQGTAKTTAAKLLIRCIDPGGAPGPLPRDERKFAVKMWNAHVHAFDNLSDIAPYQSDMLCRAATGDDYSDRTLYSDDESTSIPYVRPIILTGIDLGAIQSDLAERQAPIDLEPIAEGRRRTERTVIGSDGAGDDQGVIDEFDAAHPEILGALLDLLADVLTYLPKVGKIPLPRMADFGVVLAALDKRHEALHGEPHSTPLLGLYRNLSRNIVAESARDDVVGNTILALMQKRDEWNGTATALLKKLVQFLPPPAPDKLPPKWPTPQGLGHRIPKLAPALRLNGLEIEKDREGHNRDRTITIRRVLPTSA